MDELFPKTKWNEYIQEVNKEVLAKEDNELEQILLINEKYSEMVELYQEYPNDYPWMNICLWYSSWTKMCGIPSSPLMYPPMTNEAFQKLIENFKK